MSYDPTQPVPPPLDPTQPVSAPLDPTQLAATPASPPSVDLSAPPSAPAADAETQVVAPPPPGGYESPTPILSAALPFSWPRDWLTVVLALIYVIGLIFGFIGGAQSPSSTDVNAQPSTLATVASTIATILVLIALVGVLVLDARGYFSLRALVARRRTSNDRFLLGCLWVLFCIIFLPIYFVRRFMGKPQEGPPLPDLPAGSWPMAAPMPPSDPYSGPYSGPIGNSMSGPMPPYQSGPMSGPLPASPPGYGPPQPPMPVYMNPPMPAVPPVVIVQGAQPQPQQLIRTYKGGWRAANQKFQKDAKHLAHQGWRVQQVITTQSGAVGVNVGFGIGVGSAKAKELTVIYTR
jgi:hypothetical protein